MDFPKWYSIERVRTLRLRLVCGLYLVVVSMIAVVASDAGAQVRIRERVEIVPMALLLDAPAGDSSWAMPQSGSLSLYIAPRGCQHEKLIVLSPTTFEQCAQGWYQVNLPGTYPAGSMVTMINRVYEGYPNQYDDYPDSITVDPGGLSAAFWFPAGRNVTVQVVPAPCPVDPCQGTMTTTVTDRPTSTPRDCEGAGGIAYPNWNPPPYEYDPPYNVEVSVCEGAGSASCQWLIRPTSFNVEVLYGTCTQNLANKIPIPTDWRQVVTTQNAAAVLQALCLRKNGLLVPLEQRPFDLNNPGHRYTVVEFGDYYLPDALWDHEKAHVPGVKGRLFKALADAQENLDQRCVPPDDVCAIVNDPEGRRAKTSLAQILIRQSFDDLTKEARDDEEVKIAQRAEAMKYVRIIEEISRAFGIPGCH